MIVFRRRDRRSGAAPTNAYRTTTFNVESGDQVVLRTSGARRARRRDGEAWGNGRLVEKREACARLPARETGRETQAALEEWTRPEAMERNGDVTILVAVMP